MSTYNWNLGKTDNGGRWYPTDEFAKLYIDENGYREPSRSFPLSYLRACSTQKFNRSRDAWLKDNKDLTN